MTIFSTIYRFIYPVSTENNPLHRQKWHFGRYPCFFIFLNEIDHPPSLSEDLFPRVFFFQLAEEKRGHRTGNKQYHTKEKGAAEA